MLLDPLVRSHDWNMLNNRKLLRFAFPQSLAASPGADYYFHRYFSTRVRRERLTVGLQPVVWYNDAGGVTLGVRAREDYLGRYEQNVAQLSSGTGWGVDDGPKDGDFFFRARNPVYLRAPNLSQTLDVYNVEGRFGATATLERSRRDAPHLRLRVDPGAHASVGAAGRLSLPRPRLLRRRRHGRAAPVGRRR